MSKNSSLPKKESLYTPEKEQNNLHLYIDKDLTKLFEFVRTLSFFNAPASTFALLPTGVNGMIRRITDSNTAVWGATIAGGGANNVLAYFNGTNWTVVAK